MAILREVPEQPAGFMYGHLAASADFGAPRTFVQGHVALPLDLGLKGDDNLSTVKALPYDLGREDLLVC